MGTQSVYADQRWTLTRPRSPPRRSMPTRRCGRQPAPDLAPGAELEVIAEVARPPRRRRREQIQDLLAEGGQQSRDEGRAHGRPERLGQACRLDPHRDDGDGQQHVEPRHGVAGGGAVMDHVQAIGHERRQQHRLEDQRRGHRRPVAAAGGDLDEPGAGADREHEDDDGDDQRNGHRGMRETARDPELRAVPGSMFAVYVWCSVMKLTASTAPAASASRSAAAHCAAARVTVCA